MNSSIKLISLVSLTLGAASCSATIFTYTLQWSGAALSNSATATATITVDDALLANPGSYFGAFLGGPVTAIDLTVAGASAGNGTFTTSDFSGGMLIFDTGGVTLDLSTEFVGQGGWGISTGDFNIFGSGSAPVGWDVFTLGADGGSGDLMLLTSFAPASVPEPSMLAALIGLGGLGFVLGQRRR